MLNLLLIYFGKIISKIFRLLNLGNGSTWPGHIALSVNKHFVMQAFKNSNTKIIIVAGTNGKTTTSALITKALQDNGKKVMQNLSGANLLNGIASTIVLHANADGKLDADFAIFEIDENTLPQILKEITPNYLLLLNLFRDQLDRYGEVNIVASRWKEAIDKLSEKTTLILNADDPQIAYLGIEAKAKTLCFGLNEDQTTADGSQASDSDYCPQCGTKLHYKKRVFSHLGDWQCPKCSLRRPNLDMNDFSTYPLPGTYNKYNSLASVLLLRQYGMSDKHIAQSFTDFTPAFGRQETLQYRNKKVQIFLSKNPTSFNQSFQTISDLGAKTLLFVLNDRIPDGRDISWIWDTEMPAIDKFKHVLISGDRVYDMALRIHYEDYKNFKTYENLDEAINEGIKLTDDGETFFILPTYSAMLESRKILTGKKIL